MSPPFGRVRHGALEEARDCGYADPEEVVARMTWLRALACVSLSRRGRFDETDVRAAIEAYHGSGVILRVRDGRVDDSSRK